MILVVSCPILFGLLFQSSFNLSWNQGHGGFIFALVLIIIELLNIKNILIDKNRILISLISSVFVIMYFVSLQYGFRSYLENVALTYNVKLVLSWMLMWDFVIITIFVIIILGIFLGRKFMKLVPAVPVFLFGNSVILLLDAVFPYDTLGLLQYVVPYILKLNANIITYTNIGTAIASDNLLFLNGDYGPFAFKVFWPSAGVHSVIIYSLVMAAFLLKMNIDKKRKIMYFGIGIFGTISINLIRIFLLSIFVLKVSTNAIKFEEFHSVAGEIIFIPWLIIFLITVILIESKIIEKKLNSN